MALQNRVDPFGELVATPARGMLLGNRGGQFHRADRSLGRRRWTSRRWIACVCSFKGRRREVWGHGYTELFFLDEVTAFAAGHRPCFECRRAEAEAFRALFGGGSRPTADEMDVVLDDERRRGREKRLSKRAFDPLPDGAMIALEGHAFAVRDGALSPWSFAGYGAPRKPPRGADVDVLTPPSILRVLAGGYRPRWAGAQ